jgi:hypothetical protein
MPGSAYTLNIMLAAVARRLEPLLGEVAFVGGATVALYLTRQRLSPVKSTRDVDLIVEVASRGGYSPKTIERVLDWSIRSFVFV